jgi:Transcriptional regulator, AbiEi antitoxin, Type IV TA system/Transcriptional regulator, AbiEi antitoxin N-terminal domain
MGIQKGAVPNRLLNRLLKDLPEGVAVPSAWLSEQGISPQLVRKYVAGGWLTTLAHGAYARPALPVDWQGVVLALQRLAQQPIHVGGLSALNLQDLAHYLPVGGEPRIHLWNHGKGLARLPAWVSAISLPQQFVFHRQRLLEPAIVGEGVAHVRTRVRDWTLTVSSPERAILEVLSLVDESAASFTYEAELFDGLPAPRPVLVQHLLEGCVSIKVKRLLLFLATRHETPWSRKLNADRVALGQGKRLVTRGGRLDTKFSITVPEAFHVAQG